MYSTRPLVLRTSRALAALLVAGALAGCVSVKYSERSRPVRTVSADASTSAPATGTMEEVTPSAQAPALTQYVLRDAIEPLGQDLITYHEHVVTLANPFFEGRSADTRGNRLAADYLSFHFEKLGLEPAFAGEEGTSPGELSYLQGFSVPGDVEVTGAVASYDAGGDTRTLRSGEDFSVLGASGNGRVTGRLAFVGYSIGEGEDGYSSYAEDDDLTGRIALILRFEPMDFEGKSLWSNVGRWTGHAGLTDKITGAAERGAAGVILVNPPGADDPRAGRLATTGSTRFSESLDIPVVMFDTNEANALIKKADPEGRNLMKWRVMADEGELAGAVMLDGAEVTLETELQHNRYQTQNVGAILEGRGDLANEWLVVGGHYDHVGYGNVGGARASNRGKLHPGADDNASGAAGVLMVASAMKAMYDESPDDAQLRSVLFLEFGAEEMGLLGSAHYVENATVSASQVMAMLNMDMIGRMSDAKLTVYGLGTADEWGDILTPYFEQSGLAVETIDAGTGASDHTNFYRAGIPVLHFFSGLHPDYHQPGDFSWKVNYVGAMDILDIVIGVAEELAARPERLTFETTQASARGGRPRARVRLGIAPGTYAEDTTGVVVGDVFPDTSASKGGMKPGDRIIRWDGEEVAGVMSMMEHLSSHEPGDVAEIVVVRDGAEVTLKVTLQGRDEGDG